MGSGVFQGIASRFLFHKKSSALQWHPATELAQGAIGATALAVDRHGLGLVIWENQEKLWMVALDNTDSPALTGYPLGDGFAPKIAMNEGGRGVALWLQKENGQVQIQAARLSMDEIDIRPQTIFQTSGRVHHVQAGVDRRGGVIVVWVHESQAGWQILTRNYDFRSDTWDIGPQVLGGWETSPLEPCFALNAHGQAMVLVPMQSTEYEGIVAYHYWPTERLWSDHAVPVAPRFGKDIRLIINRSGDALALWVLRSRGRKDQLESAYFRSSVSEWDKPCSLATAMSIRQTKLVMVANGKTLALWHQQEEGSITHFFGKHGISGAWDVQLERLDMDGSPARDCAVTQGPRGHMGLLLVHPGPTGELPVYLTWNGTWSMPTHLREAAGGQLSQPCLAMGTSYAAAVWRADEGGTRRLFYCRAS